MKIPTKPVVLPMQNMDLLMPLWLEAIGMKIRRHAADRAEAKCPFHEGRALKLGLRMRNCWIANCMSCGVKGTLWDLARLHYEIDPEEKAAVVRERVLQEISEYMTSGPEAQAFQQTVGARNAKLELDRVLTPGIFRAARGSTELAPTAAPSRITELQPQTLSPVQQEIPQKEEEIMGESEGGDQFLRDALAIFGAEDQGPLDSWAASNRASVWHRERTQEMLQNPGGSWRTPERSWRFSEDVDLLVSAEKGCQNLAKLRGLTYEGVRLAHEWGHLRFGYWRNRACWFLVADGGWMIEARRMDGKPFECGAKALAFTGSTKSRALVGAEQIPLHRGPLRLVEGGPDFLAACSLFWMEGDTAGKQEHLPLAVLTLFWTPRQLHKIQLFGRQVQIVAHNDDAGRRIAKERAETLKQAGASVSVLEISSVWPDAPAGGDLNDLMSSRQELISKLMK